MSLPKLCRIYARVSMRKGVIDLSTARQIERGLERAAERGETPVVYEEPVGHNSGKNEKRTRWRDLWQDCEAEPDTTGSVVVCNLSRFSRADNVMELLQRLKRWHIDFIDLDEPFDIGTYEGRRLVRSKSTQNAQYADDISKWTLDAARKHRAKGWYWGRAPMGLTTELNADGKGKHLALSGETYVVTPGGETREFLETVTEYCRLRALQGLSRTAAVWRLRAGGYKWRGKQRVQGQWQPVVISKTHLDYLDRILPKYQGFVDDTLLRGAMEVRAARARWRQNGRTPRATALLARILYCKGCGHRYYQGVYLVEGGTVEHRYYRHRDPALNQKATRPCPYAGIYNAPELERAVWDDLRRRFDLSPEQVRKAAEHTGAQAQPGRAALDLALKREALEKRVMNLILMLADRDMDAGDVKPLLAAAKKELADLPLPTPGLPALRPLNATEKIRLIEQAQQLVARGAELDAATANRWLHSLFARITLDGEGRLDYEMYPDLKAWFPLGAGELVGQSS